jgi:hypothetical protein
MNKYCSTWKLSKQQNFRLAQIKTAPMKRKRRKKVTKARVMTFWTATKTMSRLGAVNRRCKRKTWKTL